MDPSQINAILERLGPIPAVEHFGLHVEEFDEGYCRMIMPKREGYAGIFGSVHGGLLMLAADSAACFAIMTVTGPDQPLTTTDMNIRFLAPCMTDVVAVARTIKVGRTLCPTNVELFDTEGKPVAVAQVTYIRLEKPPEA